MGSCMVHQTWHMLVLDTEVVVETPGKAEDWYDRCVTNASMDPRLIMWPTNLCVLCGVGKKRGPHKRVHT